MPTDLAQQRLMDPSPPVSTPVSARARKGLKIAAVAGVGLVVLVVACGLISRMHQSAQVARWTVAEATPSVSVISPTAAASDAPLTLPGHLQAFYNAQIFPRVSGYVHGWYADIGAHVTRGQLLATIDTPELDQQLIQARADLASAQANRRLASTTAARWASLLSQDAVSKQESDEKSGDLDAKIALANAAKANVDRLLALKAFARIVAPFDGVVTARRTDIGALVNAGAGSSSELFDVSQVDKLRLYVRVPQSYAARIQPGVTARLVVPEHPGKVFDATFTSTADAVNDASGTLLVEMAVQNPNDELKTGDYAQVTFNLQTRPGASASILALPASALLFTKAGLQVAVVQADHRVRLKAVAVSRDLGDTVEITGDLSKTDRVINSPSDSLKDGQRVDVTADSGSLTPSAGDAPAAGRGS